ncbi:hypothetical protein BKA70DRAFT_1432476 [Coprinopsis sp. MPI-PUGE-AT-0042]|nr:hypothetical protein BKA70DRAFT_1432476 [Coprinopsis sp. MPI-PUGE-AT-0042]
MWPAPGFGFSPLLHPTCHQPLLAREQPPPDRTGNQVPPTSTSTPTREGTSNDSESKTKPGTRANLNAMMVDLEDTEEVSLVLMLKALLRRMYELEEDDKLDISTSWDDEQQIRRDRICEQAENWAITNLRHLLTSAANFCNGDQSLCEEMKSSLKDALEKNSEQERYTPLVKALNAILLNFIGMTIGDLAHSPCSDDLIYMAHSGDTISSSPLSAHTAAATKLKPDIIATSIHHLCGSLELPIGCNAFHGMGRPLHCGEVKYKKKDFKVAFPAHFDSKRILAHVDSLVPPSQKPINGNDAEPSQGFPKFPTERRKQAQGRSERQRGMEVPSTNPTVGQSYTVTPTVQMAYYGMDLLRAKWDKMHSVVLHFNDNKISLRWYDPQGCIFTTPVDIVSQLPLFVALIALFQRFNKQMHGSASFELKAVIQGEEIPFDIPDTSATPWQLKGRHTVTASPIRKGSKGVVTAPAAHPGHSIGTRAATKAAAAVQASSPPEKLRDLFFKLTWREEVRSPEGYIIQTAKDRANRYLPHPEWVTDHLPDVKYYGEYRSMSTKHIRLALGIISDDHRVPTIMLSTKLVTFDDVDPLEFSQRFWEIIRCHRLLWAIGIAHGDLSFSNLMVTIASARSFRRAILNDFDLASIMRPGRLYPFQIGFRRTGTKAFMALALLTKADGSIPRIYRHDLESILWCMLWYVSPQVEWLEGRFSDVRRAKREWAQEVDSDVAQNVRTEVKKLWEPVTTALYDWVQADGQAKRNPRTDEQWMDIISSKIKPPSSIGSEWMAFRVPEDSIRPEDSQTNNLFFAIV